MTTENTNPGATPNEVYVVWDQDADDESRMVAVYLSEDLADAKCAELVEEEGEETGRYRVAHCWLEDGGGT